MLKITGIEPGSPASKIGLICGDELISLNRHPIKDLIDYRFYQAEYSIVLRLARNGKPFSKLITKGIDSDLGLYFEPDRIIRCRNNCVFCFVRNNPRGLRQPLYVKDDDYRLSFIHGNFVTMTNVSDEEIHRIIKQRLSPMYISVQATDEPTRQLLFGRKHLPSILPILRKLAESQIYFHSQVVIVPGYNNGHILDKTAADLAELRPFAQSLAVVPVGLTKYSRTAIGDGGKVKPVDKSLAGKLITQVSHLRDKYGDSENNFVYAADELFIRSNHDIPPESYYDDFPQIENGVGLVRQFLDSFPRKVPTKQKNMLREKGIWITGKSMKRIWDKFILPQNNIQPYLLSVSNSLFGPKVTVTGLLAGKDILRELYKLSKKMGPVILPPNCLNADYKFIDDFTPQELADKTGLDIVQGTYNFGETLRLIA